MRFVTYRWFGRVAFGALVDEWVVDVHRAYTLMLTERGAANAEERARADCPGEAVAFLRAGRDALTAAARAVEWAQTNRERARANGAVTALSDVRLMAPIPRPGKIIGIGLNYADHAREAGLKVPEVPTVFGKFANTVVGPGDGVEKPRVSDELDYEVELGVVIGRTGRSIPEAVAMDYVFGYTVVNDISVRDYQMRTGQWMIGKTFDTHCPMGPAIVTADEIPDPHSLDISCYVNGERLQHSNTRHLIFRIPQLIAYLSEVMTLEPGDVIATGTPAGVGFVRNPPIRLRVGDVVVAEVQQVGRLENPIVPQR